jgi:hypothetical protein
MTIIVTMALLSFCPFMMSRYRMLLWMIERQCIHNDEKVELTTAEQNTLSAPYPIKPPFSKKEMQGATNARVPLAHQSSASTCLLRPMLNLKRKDSL